MSTTPTAPSTTQPCTACAAPLADDQRYCLSCGEVRPGARRQLPAALRRSATPEPAVVPPAARWAGPTLTSGLAGLACLLLAIGVGVLIGRGASDQPVPAAITISGAAAGAATGGAASQAAAPATFTSDWPAGRQGWTIALQTLPKGSTDPAAVARAKADAREQGASAAGALDSADYASLTAGSYVVYTGLFGSRRAAAAALVPLRKTFGDARVVRVAKTAAVAASGARVTAPKPKSSAAATSKSSSGGTGDAYEQSKKLPKTLGTGGKPPAKDDKPAAGGAGFEEIG